MKVTHILHEIRPSGAEVMLNLAASHWQRAGWTLEVVATAPDRGAFADELERSGFTVHHVPSDLRNPRSVFILSGFLASRHPDVVHVHTERSSAMLATSLMFRRLPVVRTIHNAFPYTGCLRIQKTLERFVERLSGSRQISISQSVFENEKRRLLNPTTLCWNWFDDETYRPPTTAEREAARFELGLGEGQMALVSVGNGNDIKNYPAIVEAVAELARGKGDQNPSPIYLMVGNEHPERLERESAVRVGVFDRIRFCGPQKDVRKFLWAADVFVMPSHYEGFGLSAVEAMATGVACVFSDCPGLRDFREFPFDIQWSGTDSSSIAGALAELIGNGRAQERHEVSAAAVRREFGVAKRCAAYEEIWRSEKRNGKR